MARFRPVSVRFAPLGLFFLISAASLQAVSIGGNAGLTVTVSSDGSYQIAVPNPAWQFAGSIGVTPSNVTVVSGIDTTGGSYSEISFDFSTDARSREHTSEL